MAGISQTNAIGQLGHGSVLNGIDADKFRGMSIFNKGFVEEGIEWHTAWDLDAKDLARYFTREPTQAHHDNDHQANDHCTSYRQEIEFRSDRHAYCHDEENKTHVVGFFDRVPKTNDGQCPRHFERPRNIRADVHRDQCHHHAIDDERENKTLGKRSTAMRDLLNPDHTLPVQHTRYSSPAGHAHFLPGVPPSSLNNNPLFRGHQHLVQHRLHLAPIHPLLQLYQQGLQEPPAAVS